MNEEQLTSDRSDNRIAELEAAILELLKHLDAQYWQTVPPGDYRYSLNVTAAMNVARRLVSAGPKPSPEDVGGPTG